jgi:uncharacterized RDD family membrane protein YckC
MRSNHADGMERTMKATKDGGKILRTASIWQRSVGAAIDFVLFTPVLAIPAWTQSVSTLAACLVLLPMAGLALAYPIYFHARYGQTVGKLVVGIRLVRADGEPIGTGTAWARSALDLVFAAATGIALVAALSGTLDWLRNVTLAYALWTSVDLGVMLTNRGRRAAHDYLAGTFVVSDQVQQRGEPRTARMLRRRGAARGA